MRLIRTANMASEDSPLGGLQAYLIAVKLMLSFGGSVAPGALSHAATLQAGLDLHALSNKYRVFCWSCVSQGCLRQTVFGCVFGLQAAGGHA